jgi:aspartate aminotransferase
VDIIGFGAGEPDFDTPDNIKEAAKKAIDAGFTKYTPVGGTDELKDAIIAKLKKDNGLDYARNEISVACGAKHSLYNISQALIQEGDEVIIPAPYWVSYPDQVILAGGKPVFIETDESTAFKITPEQLEKAITRNTRALILNSPCNPTGSTYSKDELKRLGEVCLRHDFAIITDDIYERLLYDNQTFYNIVNALPALQPRVIVDVISAMTKMQSQSTSNPSSIAQKAAVEALNGPQDAVTRMVIEFEKRRTYIIERLNAIPGVSCFKSTGAFYAFPNFSQIYGKSFEGTVISNSTDFAAYLLEQAKVALVPGIAFGADKFARLSYSTSMENITKGLDRIETAVRNLK